MTLVKLLLTSIAGLTLTVTLTACVGLDERQSRDTSVPDREEEDSPVGDFVTLSATLLNSFSTRNRERSPICPLL